MALIYEKKERIVVMTLNRPEALNALAPETYREFSEVCIRFRDDPDAWVAIITGAGDKAFCAGADLKKTIPLIMEGKLSVPPSIRRGLDIYKPFIAAVNGTTRGGGLEIALACDLRIASESATFAQGEARWGLIPGQGGTQRLPRIVGMAKAMELVFLADALSAEEALRIGLVNKVVPPAQLMPTALEWANKICQNSPLAIRAAKKAMLLGVDAGLDYGLKLEETLAEQLYQLPDVKEGLSAFAEKRKPVYGSR